MRGVTGSRVYDVIHIRAAQKVGCTRLYTFSVRHFRELAPAALQEAITFP
jgi:predicted nucleic acid-binding protein